MRTPGPTDGPSSAQGAGRGKHPRTGALVSEGDPAAKPGSAGRAPATGSESRPAVKPAPEGRTFAAAETAPLKPGTASALAALRAEGLPRPGSPLAAGLSPAGGPLDGPWPRGAARRSGEEAALTLAVERLRSAALPRTSSPGAAAGPREALRVAARLAIAARAEAKGLMASRDLVDFVERLSGEPLAREDGSCLPDGLGREGGGGGGTARDGSDKGGGSGEGNDSEDSSGERPEAKPDGAAGLDPSPLDLDRPIAREIPETDLPRELGAFLKALIFKSGGEGSLLNLFNHSPSSEGGWIYAPLRFGLDSVAFSGSIRIQLPKAKGGPFRAESRFVARCGEREDEWALCLVASPGGSRARLSVAGDEAGKKAGAAEPDFALELSRLGCSFRLAGQGEAGGEGMVDLRA